MALVAVHAVVDISLDALMVPVCLRFRVAIGALEYRIVVRIRMARRADSICIPMIDRERRVLRVIEGGVLPVRRVMTVLASRREKLRLRRVSRICGPVIVRQVTSDTCRWQRLVVVIDVAINASARRHRMRSGQHEIVVVVER